MTPAEQERAAKKRQPDVFTQCAGTVCYWRINARGDHIKQGEG